MDSARFQSNINLHPTPSESTKRVGMEAWRHKTKFNRMAIGMSGETERQTRPGKESEKNQPAAIKVLR